MKPATLRTYLPTSAPYRRINSARRRYAVQAPGAPTLEIFNQHVKHLQKERAAGHPEQSRKVDYLRNEVAQRLCDRLLDIQRHFPNVLDFGANSCNIARAISNPTLTPPSDVDTDANLDDVDDDATRPTHIPAPLTSRISNLICADTSPSLLHRDDDHLPPPAVSSSLMPLSSLETLPFSPNTFDAVLSSLSLHWVNDLPSVLAQINSILKPDAPLLAAMMGGDSLFELRTSLQLADLERRGGVSPRISPMADVRDIGGLLTRAGFKLLTVDVDDIVVEYPDSFALMTDLQAMGESSAILKTTGAQLSRDVLLANEAIYRQLHGEEGRGDVLPATYRIIYMIGWKEGKGQEKPLPRGSGEINLKDILGGGSFDRP